MGEQTGIAWCDHTFNPWKGCMKVSPGCKYCYALDQAKRWKWDSPQKRIWGPALHPRTGEIHTRREKTSETNWNQPFKWDKDAKAQGVRRKVFCASLADVFEDHPEVDQWRVELWAVIRQTPNLDWLLLTKRPENLQGMLPWEVAAWHNVWLGTSVETQEYAQKRIPVLTQVPAVIRFLSCEPLLGPLDLTPWLSQLQWVIVGGESGPKHRAMDLAWARAIREQCDQWAVPYFFKQVGGRTHSSGGHLLDGEEYYTFPRR